MFSLPGMVLNGDTPSSEPSEDSSPCRRTFHSSGEQVHSEEQEDDSFFDCVDREEGYDIETIAAVIPEGAVGGRSDGWTGDRMDGRSEGRAIGWTDDRMDGRPGDGVRDSGDRAPAGHDSPPPTTGVEQYSSGRRKNSFFSSDHDSIPVSSSHVASSGASSFRNRSSFFSATPPRTVRSFFSHLDGSVASRSVRGLNWLKLSSQQVLDIATDLATKLTAAAEVVLGEERKFARHALHSYDVELGDGSLRAALAANPSRFSNCWYRQGASYVLSLGWVTPLAARGGGFFSWAVRWVLESLPRNLMYGGFEPTVILSAQTTSLQLGFVGLFSWPGVDAFLRWVKAAPASDEQASFHVSFTSPRRSIDVPCVAGAQQTEEDEDLELDNKSSSKTAPAAPTRAITQPPFNELVDVTHFFGREVASMRYVAARAEDPLTPRLEFILSGPLGASLNVVGFYLLIDDIILPFICFPFSVDGNRVVCDPTQANAVVFVRESALLGGGSGDHGGPPDRSEE